MERIDKVLGNLGYGTRKEIKKFIKERRIFVDNKIVMDSSFKLNPETSKITIDNEDIIYKKYIYLIMNKPSGVISATWDKYDRTVLDLIEEEHRVFNPFPVGRLDKDTVGMLLITNDGDLNHKLISPKNHVKKVYYAKIDGEVNSEHVEVFKNGVILEDSYKCLSSELKIINSGTCSEVYVTVFEGKYHQVKRMFESIGTKVTYLKRMEFGELKLPEDIKEGEYRELKEEEFNLLINSFKLL